MPTLFVDADLLPGAGPTGSLLSGRFGPASRAFARTAEASPEPVAVALHYRGELADRSQLFVARGAHDRPLGIVQLSSGSAPRGVSTGVAQARLAAAHMGARLDGAVLLPLAEGEVEGRSYAVLPYCGRGADRRWRGALERSALRPAVLDWLRGVAAATFLHVPGFDLPRRFIGPIERVRALAGASDRLVAASDRALSRLASGDWVPRHVFMHGDLRRDNLWLRPPFLVRSAGAATRLAVIDWAVARRSGYPFFDLVRAAEALEVGDRTLRAEVARHGAILGCEPIDAPGCALAAVGARLGEIGPEADDPRQALLERAESSLRRLESAVSPRPGGRARRTAA